MTQPNTTGSFEEFLEKHRGEIDDLQRLLSTELPDNPTELEVALRHSEAQYARMTTIRAWADSWLDIASHRLLPPKEGRTELEREKELDALVVQHRRFRDICSGLCDAIGQRLSLGQSLLKAQQRETSRES